MKRHVKTEYSWFLLPTTVMTLGAAPPGNNGIFQMAEDVTGVLSDTAVLTRIQGSFEFQVGTDAGAGVAPPLLSIPLACVIEVGLLSYDLVHGLAPAAAADVATLDNPDDSEAPWRWRKSWAIGCWNWIGDSTNLPNPQNSVFGKQIGCTGGIGSDTLYGEINLAVNRSIDNNKALAFCFSYKDGAPNTHVNFMVHLRLLFHTQ